MSLFSTAATAAKLSVDLSLGGNFIGNLTKAQRQLTAFDSQVSRTSSRSFRAGQQIGNGIKNIAKVTVGLVSTGAGLIGASLKLAGDFEAQLNTINTIAHKTPTELAAVGQQLRDISKKTGQSLDDLTQGYYDLLSAGVKAADAQAVLNDAVTLGIGGLATTAQTVDLLTTAYNAYGLDAKGAAKATDQFALAIQDGKVTADQIAASFANVASLAHTYHIGIDQIAASYADLTAQGVPAAEVTTQMQRAIIELLKPSAELTALGKKIGIKSFQDELGKKGLVGTLQEIRLAADKTHRPLTDFFGRVEAVKYALATTGPNFKGYEDELAKMGKASGVAAAQMAERQQGLNFQLGRLKALAKDAGITIGSALLPKITPLVEKLNDLIQTHAGDISNFADQLAGAFSKENIDAALGTLKDLFNAAKELLPTILEAGKITGQALKIAVDAFKSLPPDLQKLLVAGLAVNKLTGGLVTNVAGGIVGAILGQLKSAVVNVEGAVVNVNGGVPGVGGPGGSGLGSLLPALGLAALIDVAAVPIGKAFADALPPALKGPGGTGQSQSQQARAAADAAMGRGGASGSLDSAALHNLAPDISRSLDGPLGKMSATLVRSIDKLHADFRTAVEHLSGAKTAAQIRAAIKEVNQSVFGKGIGGSGGGASIVKELQKDLQHTHDPVLAKELRSEIARLNAKVAGRKILEGLFQRADKIEANGHLTTAQKIARLQRIEAEVGARSHKAAEKIAARIEAEKKSLAAKLASVKSSEDGIKGAINAKDWSPSINLSVPITVNARNVTRSQQTYNHYYASAARRP